MAMMLAMAGAACAPEDEPFPFDYHGTPTPSPVPVADATPEKIITHKYDIISKGETIKIAEWDDNTLRMLNFLAGYVIIFGFDHAVERSPSGRPRGQALWRQTLLAGDVHLVLWMEEDWHEATGGDAGIVDLGTVYEAESNLRIGSSPALEEASQEIVQFLGSFVPGDAPSCSPCTGLSDDSPNCPCPRTCGVHCITDYRRAHRHEAERRGCEIL